MRDFFSVIRDRRSIRRFDPDKEISEDVLTRILEAGRLAPTASNRQPFRFLVIRNRQLREKIYQAYDRDWLRNAPVILIPVGEKEETWFRSKDGVDSLEVDLSIAMDHMILAAEAEGVGSCWIMAYDYEVIREALDLKPNQYVSCITPLGYPPDDYLKRPMPPRKEPDDLIEFID